MLLKYEGFDHESSAADLFVGILSTLLATGNNPTANVGLSPITQFGTGQSLIISITNATNGTASALAVLPCVTTSASVTVGASILLSAVPANAVIIGLMNGNLGQVFIAIAAGVIQVFLGDPIQGGTLIVSTAASGIGSYGWAYVEFIATIDENSGSVAVRVNGSPIPELSLVNICTTNDGTTGVSGGLFGTMSSGNTAGGVNGYFDDVYLLDALGVPPYTTALGPVRVITGFPTANGSTINFTNSAHLPNWQEIATVRFDADAAYNSSPTTGARDLFTTTALPNTAQQVFAVKVCAAGRIDDAGFRSVCTELNSGGTTAQGAFINLTGSYRYLSDLYTNDPNTGSAWSPSAVNALQFGYKIVPAIGSSVAIGIATLHVAAVVTAQASVNLQAVITLALVGGAALGSMAAGAVSIGRISSIFVVYQSMPAIARTTLVPVASGILLPGQFLSLSNTLHLSVTASFTQTALLTANSTLHPISGSGTLLFGSVLFGTMTINAVVTATFGQAVGLSATASLSSIQASVGANLSQNCNAVALLSSFTASAAVANALIQNIHIGLPNWLASHPYQMGMRVANVWLNNGVAYSSAYQCTTAGTSATTGGPASTSSVIIDGAATWTYLSNIDSTTLQAWATALPTTLLQPMLGQIWNNGSITTTAGAQILWLHGHVTTAINNITLRCAPGESIRDSLASGTAPLSFAAASGVSITLPSSGSGACNYIDIGDSNVVIDGIQMLDPNVHSASTMIQQDITSTALVISDCIFDGYGQSNGAAMINGGIGNFKFINNLLVDRQTGGGIAMAFNSSSNTAVNCTFIGIHAPSTGGCIAVSSTASPIKNSIFSGYLVPITGNGGPIAPVDHCLFTATSFGSTANAAIDAGSNLFFRLAVNQFVSVTTDFRLLSTADAIDTAATALVAIPASTDIAGTLRPYGLAWDIGAWEFV
jgi:hypothetical protein